MKLLPSSAAGCKFNSIPLSNQQLVCVNGYFTLIGAWVIIYIILYCVCIILAGNKSQCIIDAVVPVDWQRSILGVSLHSPSNLTATMT